MYRDIVIATDGSDVARRAANHGIELAAVHDATVHVLSVAKGFEARDQLRANADERARQSAAYVEGEATDRDLAVETVIREGDPCETILGYAGDVDADAIVVGSSTASGVDRLFQGSVASCVSLNATIPVIVVNERAGEKLAIPDDAAFTFRCPACTATLFTSPETKDRILERGCVMCGGEVTEDDFEAGVGEVTSR